MPGDRRNFPEGVEWSQDASGVTLGTEAGRPSQRTQVDLTLPTPRVWVISLIFDCCREDWNQASAMFLVNPEYRNTVSRSVTQHMNVSAPGMGVSDAAKQIGLYGWVPREICTVMESEASYSL